MTDRTLRILLIVFALSLTVKSHASMKVWSYSDGKVDCEAMLSWPTKALNFFGLKKGYAPLLHWSAAMFFVGADGQLEFGDKYETPSNLLIREQLENEHLKIPHALQGKSFSALALIVQRSAGTSVAYFFTAIDGVDSEPAQLIDLEQGGQVPLRGFNQFRINSLFAERLSVLRDRDGGFILRLIHNPGDILNPVPTPIPPVDYDLDRRTLYAKP